MGKVDDAVKDLGRTIHLLYGAGFRELGALMPVFGVLLYRDMPIGLPPRNAMVPATVLLAVTAGLSLSHLGAS
jgi:hypothetical protein